MLDVHPPEHAAHTWRDFFTHIATIVVGLLIAIGLEQSVEGLHHRHQLRETREALAHEREGNILNYGRNVQGLRNNIAALHNNLLVIDYVQKHPGARRADLPGVLVWPNFALTMNDIAWRSTQTSNVVTLMPQEEVSTNASLYEGLANLNQYEGTSWDITTKAQAFTFLDPDPTHLTADQLVTEITLIQDALLAKYRLMNAMDNLNRSFPDFKPSPTNEDLKLLSLAPPLTEEQKKDLAAAKAQTDQRLAAVPQPAF